MTIISKLIFCKLTVVYLFELKPIHVLAFIEEKNAPRIGWDGIIGQIVDSATDAEQPHHILEDILGQGGTMLLGSSPVSKAKYFRFNPIIGLPDSFAIDGTDPEKLEKLSNITRSYERTKSEFKLT